MAGEIRKGELPAYAVCSVSFSLKYQYARVLCLVVVCPKPHHNSFSYVT